MSRSCWPRWSNRPLVAECVDRLLPVAHAGTANRSVAPVWLPPLPDRLALARVISDELDPSAHRRRRAWIGAGWIGAGWRCRSVCWITRLGSARSRGSWTSPGPAGTTP